MAEQEFEILVSTHDFLQLQSRYQELQLSSRKLIEERTQINSQMLELSVQNTTMQKKISKLEDNIIYLSKQGFKMAQKLIKKDINQQNMEKTQKQYQELTQSIKVQAQLSSKNLEQKMKVAQMQHEREKAQLSSKIQDLTKEIQEMKQTQQISTKNTKELQNKRSLLQKENQQLKYNNEQLLQRKNKIKMQLDIASTRYFEQNKKVAKLEGIINQMRMEIKQSSSVNQYISQQVESKLKLQSEMQEKEKQLIYSKDRINGQNIQIKQLQTKVKQLEQTVKQLKQKVKQLKQTVKQREQILRRLEKQEKKQVKIVKKKEPSKKQILDVIQEYFSMLKVNLIESGGLTTKQINDILKSQKQPIIKFIEDSVNFMISLQKIEMEQQIHEKKRKKIMGIF